MRQPKAGKGECADHHDGRDGTDHEDPTAWKATEPVNRKIVTPAHINRFTGSGRDFTPRGGCSGAGMAE
ncbi:hypothetical protein MSAS_13500 [Mycobacterium saskatchewanense]|nr:hypothetical protein MSAS_13500 [Mycobacterium saskatchewanense]